MCRKPTTNSSDTTSKASRWPIPDRSDEKDSIRKQGTYRSNAYCTAQAALSQKLAQSAIRLRRLSNKVPRA